MVNELIEISQKFSQGIEWVQAAGGNTSVKDKESMLIKASGMRLSEISTNHGFVAVDHVKIAQFFNNGIESSEESKTSKQFVTNCILGDNTFLPSMETGFHAVLDKYVIHTHPIYLNAILCSKNSKSIIEKLFSNLDFTYIPYLAPGYFLSKQIAKSDKKPILFLENHGLITHSTDKNQAIDLHLEVIEKIKAHFSFENIDYQSIDHKKDNKFHYKDKNGLLKNINSQDLEPHLFPDQSVFLHNKITFSADQLKPIFIDLSNKTISYRVEKKQALAMHEVLMSVLWVIKLQQTHLLKSTFLSPKDVADILGMDMEKYRQSLN